MSRRQADAATPRRRGHASTQTSDSALEELVTLKRAVAAQGAELERLRAELPKLQEQSERTAVAESSASLAAQRDEQHSSRMRHLHAIGLLDRLTLLAKLRCVTAPCRGLT